MAEATLLLAQADSALLGLNTSGAAGGVAQGLAAGEPGAQGPFAQFLHARMQGADGAVPATAPAADSALPGQPLTTEAGAALPLAGNALPLPVLGDAAALLADIADLTSQTSLPESPDGTQVSIPPLALAAETPQPLLAGTAAQQAMPLADASLVNGPNTQSVQPQVSTVAMQATGQGGQQNHVATQVLPTQQQAELVARQLAGKLTAENPLQPQAEINAAQLAQMNGANQRPLGLHERLALERARSSLTAGQAASSEAAERGLSRDLLSMAGLQGRHINQLSGQDTQNQFRPEFDKLISNTGSNPVADENTYSSVLNSVPRVASTASASPMPVLNVATPVGQQGWDMEMSQRVNWMANTRLHEAQLQLHPRHLGPLEVRITYGQEQQMNVNFTVTNPAAREAVDAALPRLREMFEQQGLNLQDANVSQESYADQQRRRQGAENHRQGTDDESQEEGLAAGSPTESPPVLTVSGQGLINAYA